MRIRYILGVALLAITSLVAEVPPKYSQIRLFIPDKAALDAVWASGVDFEGSNGKIGGMMEFVAGQHELAELARRGVTFTIVEDDAGRRSREALSPAPMNALGFGFGSMGGYYTFDEVMGQLDSMKLLYPALVTTKEAIGYSNQGREIWGVKISDNAAADEDEAEALFTSLHHAREPGGMMTVLYTMWWLLENYGTDPEATYLVNNRELWFIPVVNPDGYVYNEQTNPGGGGFWRKNRRTNGDGNFGVDLNRNYGTATMWNAPNGGSSTSTGSDTYRGTAPFSEPETQAIDLFMRGHDIKTCLNFHTHGRYLIYPWGYLSGESADSLAYREFGFDMVAGNRHTTGTDLQTVSYSTRGNSDDYMYGDDTKPQTFAFTPELGNAFWPPSDQILPIAQENLAMVLYTAQISGQSAYVAGHTLADGGADGSLTAGEPFTLSTRLRNKGLGSAYALQLELSASSADIQFSSPSLLLGEMPARGDSAVSFAGTVGAAAPAGSSVLVFVDLTDSAGYAHRDTITLYIGERTVLLADDAESGTGSWTTGAGWGSSSYAHEGASSFTDSPSGNYAFNTDNALALAAPISLDGYSHAVLRFWTRWSIEPTWDFGLVEISSDGGSAWTALRSELSHAGSNRGTQAAGSWGYDGYTPGLTWVFQEIDLTAYVDEDILLRFRLTSDAADQRDGIYVDDIVVVGYRPFEGHSMLFASDNGAGGGSLEFAESAEGTDGLDSLLGEVELPPIPAPGTFDLRWQVAATNGTDTDIRETLGAGNPSNSFVALFQPGPAGYPFSIGWSGEYLLPGRWRLRDAATAGTVFDVDMWHDTAWTVSDTSVHAIEIYHTETDSFSYALNDGWNLVSLPMRLDDASKATLFPDALSSAWGFSGAGYLEADTLERRMGYWVKNSGVSLVQMAGVPSGRDTIVIPAGWALVPASAVICEQASSSFACPGCSPFFGYDGGYNVLSTLLPGRGAWVKGPRTLIHSCFGGGAAPKARPDAFLANFATLSLGDAGGGRATLYFGAGGSTTASADLYELPPVPPSGLFDARFASQSFVGEFSQETGAHAAQEIMIQSSRYPVSVAWSAPLDGATYELAAFIDGEPAFVQSIIGEGRTAIADPAITSLILARRGASSAPAAFRLLQNYPNPFNPSTTISYEIPDRSIVTLTVYNTLGETVGTLLDREDLPAGRYSSVFDASHLSSGIYFTTLTATAPRTGGGIRFSQKMLLIK